MKRLITSILAIGLLFGLSGCSEKKYTPKEVAQKFTEYAKDGNSDIFNIMTKESDAKITMFAGMSCIKSPTNEISALCKKVGVQVQNGEKENGMNTMKDIFLLLIPSSFEKADLDYEITIDKNKAVAKNKNGIKLKLKKINGFWKIDL